jgi:hypothetical protein
MGKESIALAFAALLAVFGGCLSTIAIEKKK